MDKTDFLVVGGGILGLSIARELKRSRPSAKVCLLEKESACGMHASSRNSGVLHAGFYYDPESLKAKLTRQGNAELKAYCRSRGIAVRESGKFVAARGPEDLRGLDELLRRGRANGVALEVLSAQEVRRREPRVRTFERALFSPSTATVDPAAVMAALEEDARKEGVVLRLGEAFVSRSGRRVRTSAGEIEPGFVVNAAGLYADRVAQEFGFSENYRILPFKGLYLKSQEPPGSLGSSVYPVPDLDYPFLGVHVTVAADGRLKIGPTALPAFWRENYGGLEGFRAGELAEIVLRQLGLLVFSGFDFKKVAVSELLKASRSRLVGLASRLVEGVRLEDYGQWGPAGIRAQLLDIRSRRLVMDFVLEGDESSLHVLNAVSPGFTCALPFARLVCDEAPI